MEEMMTCRIHGILVKGEYSIEKMAKLASGYVKRCIRCRIDSRIKKEFICKVHGPLTVDDLYANGKCKECHKKNNSEWKKNNRDIVNERNVKDRQKNPEKWDAIYKKQYAINKEKYGELYSLKKICDSHKMTIDQYHEMRDKQNNRCAICLSEEIRKETGSKKVSRLSIDHCHETKKVRGLLCRSCNSSIGLLKEDPIRMYRAIRYIKQGGFLGN